LLVRSYVDRFRARHAGLSAVMAKFICFGRSHPDCGDFQAGLLALVIFCRTPRGREYARAASLPRGQNEAAKAIGLTSRSLSIRGWRHSIAQALPAWVQYGDGDGEARRPCFR